MQSLVLRNFRKRCPLTGTPAGAVSLRDLVRTTTRSYAAAAGDGAAEGKDAKPEAAAESGDKLNAEARAGAEQAGGEGGDQAAAEPDALEEKSEDDEISKLSEEVDSLTEALRKKKHELLLRLADFENNKKKFTKERESRRRGATTTFARKVVDVYVEFDTFATSGNKGVEEPSEHCTALWDGVVMTRDMFKQSLERFDVQPFSPEEGQAIAVERHERVGEESQTNVVGEVVQPGWELLGKPPVILRKAQVKKGVVAPESAKAE